MIGSGTELERLVLSGGSRLPVDAARSLLVVQTLGGVLISGRHRLDLPLVQLVFWWHLYSWVGGVVVFNTVGSRLTRYTRTGRRHSISSGVLPGSLQ